MGKHASCWTTKQIVRVGLLVAFANWPHSVFAQNLTVIRHSSSATQPLNVSRLLVRDGLIYGIASGGSGYGTIFRLNTNGTGYTALKLFPTTYYSPALGTYTNTDGATPLAGLIENGDTLFGSTYEGGYGGRGTVFSIKTNGSNFSVLKHFSGPDGKAPYGELLLSDNILYGTTAAGGVFNKGTVFRMNRDGSGFQVLKSFSIFDGLLPLGGLVLGGDTLYGTTLQGGAWTNGTVFSIRTNGDGFTVLKEFTGSEGARPRFSLALIGDSLYGTTEGGFDESESIVYKIRTNGSDFEVLKTFPPSDPNTDTNTDGYLTFGPLASAGSTLFGTAEYGGSFANGVVFTMQADGSRYSVLHHFAAANGNTFTNADGAIPKAGLVRSEGCLYGFTVYGGAYGYGTLFSLSISPHLEIDNYDLRLFGYSNQIVALESCIDLSLPVWVPVQTNTIGGGALSLPYAADGSNRFFRLVLP